MKNERLLKVTGMELRIYTEDGQNIGISLNEAEQKAVGKILGLSRRDGKQLICYVEDGEVE